MDQEAEKLVQERIAKNRFANLIGMKLVKVETGYAVTMIPITADMWNPYNAVHGGVLFTAADVAGGAAAASYGRKVVTLDADFHYLEAGMNCRYIQATAREVRCGHHVMVFRLDVTDDVNNHLAEGTFTYMAID
ncbi:MAG: PaaI family thioesterase [Clostridiales bacterium]|nr:PaaI family thioesterase [Clostridiales bacterium]